MQQNDALFQIKLLSVSVYLVSVCSVAEQTLHRVASCERLHSPGPSETAVLMRLNFFLRKEITLFDAVYIRVAFPMQWAEQLLWHSEKSQRQLLKVGHLSRWVRWLVRFGCVGAEG